MKKRKETIQASIIKNHKITHFYGVPLKRLLSLLSYF